MKTKDMREALKANGHHVPRSNDDVIKLYNEIFMDAEQKENDKEVPLVLGDNIFTYVGAGDEPPHMINFMGRQVFVRGKPTEVTDLELLLKVRGHKCFVEGDADVEKMHENDVKEAERANQTRLHDQQMQAAAERQNRSAA